MHRLQRADDGGDALAAMATAAAAAAAPRSAPDYDAHINALRAKELPGLYGASAASSSAEYAGNAAHLHASSSKHTLSDGTAPLYLDAAGMPPCPLSATRAYAEDFAANFYANPHSHTPASARTAEMIEDVRATVLRELFCVQPTPLVLSSKGKGKARATGTEEELGCGWELIFTSGATASLKLVAESFDFGDPGGEGAARGSFAHLLEAHTSLAGMRGVTRARGVASTACTAVELEARAHDARSLVALPLQCNATGRRYSELAARLGRLPAKVVLDAASFLSSSSRLPLPSPSDAEAYAAAPDFIAFSFYKLFGAPTGLGGLLVKRSSAGALARKPYFGGGTLSLLLPRSGALVPRARLADSMEDGTLHVHGILALKHSMHAHARLLGTWQQRAAHVEHLTQELYRRLAGLRHGNGRPLVRLLSRSAAACSWAAGAGASADAGDPPADTAHDQGPISAFLLLLPDGARVPMSEIARIAALRNVHVRVGRHCNAGVALTHTLPAAAAAAAADSEDAADDGEHDSARLDADEQRLWEIWEAGTGCDNADGADDGASSVRVSLSVWSTLADVDALVAFLEAYFLVENPAPASHAPPAGAYDLDQLELKTVTLYPIKSCAGQELARGEAWPLTPHGLLHDREWCIVDVATGKALSQKRVPQMATIRAHVDRASGTLRIVLPALGEEDGDDEVLEIDMGASAGQEEHDGIRVCADTVRPHLYLDAHIVRALSDFLQRDCTLARLPPQSSTRHGHFDAGALLADAAAPRRAHGLEGPMQHHAPILLSNESPFLLVNEDSVQQVMRWIQADAPSKDPAPLAADDVARRFRANFVVGPRRQPRAIESASSSEGSQDGSETLSTPPTSPPASRSPSQLGHDAIRKPAELSASAGATAFVPLAEDGLARLQLGAHTFAALGPCRRCEMVAVDQRTGAKRPETLLSLARRRRSAARGRVEFGTHLCWVPTSGATQDEEPPLVHVGMSAALTYVS